MSDGDSQMHSSLSSEDETETLFPAANKPHLNQAFSSELSPPSSQDPPTCQNGAPAEDDMMDYTPGQQNGNVAAVGEQTSVRESGRKMEMGDKPGAAWNNPRAHEEYSRAMESVVDPKFNLREFGDPFDESDMQVRWENVAKETGKGHMA